MGYSSCGHKELDTTEQLNNKSNRQPKDDDLASLHLGLSLPSPPNLILAHFKIGRKLHPYNGVLFSHKMELTTDTCYNVDKV